MRRKVSLKNSEMSNSEILGRVFTYILGLIVFGLHGVVMSILFFKAVQENKREESVAVSVIGIFICFLAWLISFA